MTAIFPSSFGISSSSLSVEPSISGSEAGIRLQWNDHRRLQVAFADERKRVELFRDFVGRSGFHNRASASGVTAQTDLSNQTGRVEGTYHLELRLPEVCGSRGFRLIGMPGEQGHELHFDRSLSYEAWFPEGPGYGQAPGAAQPGIRMGHPGSAGTAHSRWRSLERREGASSCHQVHAQR